MTHFAYDELDKLSLMIMKCEKLQKDTIQREYESNGS